MTKDGTVNILLIRKEFESEQEYRVFIDCNKK